MPAPILQFKRGLLVDLPGLRDGEPGFTTDSYDLYVGIDSTTNNNKFFGSHRYWTKNTASTGSGVNFVEGTTNGTQYLTLKAPDTLAGITTFVLPGSQGSASSVLTNDGSGNLTWSSGSASPVFSGISSFIDTTDNTFGNENTGAVQIDGGVGIAKNLTVKQNLYVGGFAEFVGVVTFKGGTINLGDGNTDDINVGGEFISSLIPNTDNAHDLGSNANKWRNLNVVSVATTSINASGAVNVGTALSAPTVKTATIQHSNATNAATIDASGNITAAQNLTISGNLFVNGSTTQVNTAAITVEDRTIELGVVDGSAPTSATTWDLGVLFNYHASTAKKSAVIWEQGDARFKFASVLAADSDGSNVNTPQLTVTTFAPIEIGSLFVNDCAGASQVISCTGSTRKLENITIDCGTF